MILQCFHFKYCQYLFSSMKFENKTTKVFEFGIYKNSFEDTKGVIRRQKSKNRQYNGQ